MSKIKTISLEEFSDIFSDKIAESCEDKGLTQQLDFSLEQEIELEYFNYLNPLSYSHYRLIIKYANY